MSEINLNDGVIIEVMKHLPEDGLFRDLNLEMRWHLLDERGAAALSPDGIKKTVNRVGKVFWVVLMH